MLKLFKKIFTTGILTENVSSSENKNIEIIGKQCQKIVNKYFSGSLAIRQVDAGSCNGCELEIHALNNVFYNLERFGIHLVASPRHADMLLVTGPVTKHLEAALKITYAALPEPKLVIAVGNCGANGGEFGKSYACLGGISEVIPVDAVIKGCPPTPLDMLQGILLLIQKKRLTTHISREMVRFL